MTSNIEDKLLSDAFVLNKEEFVKLLEQLQSNYYNTLLEENDDTISDATYDKLVDIYQERFEEEYKKVGALPSSSQIKEDLPFYMGSLKKVKDDKNMKLWLSKYPGCKLVIMEKVDGISAGMGKKLHTRGNGKKGANISHILDYIKVPKMKNNTYARIELVMPKSKFEKKYKDKMANARNMVSGLLGAKNSFDSSAAKDLLPLAYRFINTSEEKETKTQSEQLQHLHSLGFKLPWYEIKDQPEDIDEFILYLANLIKERTKESDYDIDGLVLYADGLFSYPEDGDPKHAVAFKSETGSILTEVEFVEWNKSKRGLMKPRVKVKPVYLSGVKIEWASGHNARYIVDNRIGYGTIIEITRSGEVIPYIKSVFKPADEPDLPDEEFTWTTNKKGEQVDIVAEDCEEIQIKKIIEFFKTLDAKYVGEKTILKIYEAGYTNLSSFFNLKVENLLKLQGFKQTSAQKVVDAIQKSITNVPLARIAAASGLLGHGFGEKKVQLVVDDFPEFLETKLKLDDLEERIKEIAGFDTTARLFAENIPVFKKFLDDHPAITLETNITFESEDETSDTNDNDEKTPSIKDKTIVFTKVRDKELEVKIKKKGGKVTTSVSGKTNIVIVETRFGGSSKELKADEINDERLEKDYIEIIELKQFKLKYGFN